MPSQSTSYRKECNIDGVADRVRWLPSVPDGPADLDGRLTKSGLVVWGHQDSEEDNLLVIEGLVMIARGNQVLAMEEEMVTAYFHTGKVTDLHVCETGSGLVTVLMGTTAGSLHLLRLVVPRTPGAGPQELKVLEQPKGWPGTPVRSGQAERSEMLGVWLRPHRGAVAAVDMQQDTQNILSAGADGSLYVLEVERVATASASPAMHADVDSEDTMDTGEQLWSRAGGGSGGALPPGILPYKAGSGCVGYTCGRWVDRSLFITSRTVGGLEMWDVRCPPIPVSRTPPDWGATGMGPADRGCHRVIYSLHVHPARPDLCVSGGSGGSVALWDLRAASRSLALTQPEPSAGPVWEVRFNVHEGAQYGTNGAGSGQHAALPSVLFCTEEGALCRVSTADAGAATAGAVQPPPFGQPEEVVWQGSGGASTKRRGPQVLSKLSSSYNSFDLGGPFGSDVIAVTGRQTLQYMQLL